MKTQDDIFRAWDLYDRIGRANYMKQREIAASIRLALGSRIEPLRVLDLGCGDGAMSQEFLAKSRVVTFVGVDLSESAIERLKGRSAPGTSPDDVRRNFVRGDIEAGLTTMPADAFDLVYAGYSLHHFQTDAKRRVLDEIARVLDRGGWLIWTDIIRNEGESRDGYIDRLEAEIGSNWRELAPEERRSVVEHVRACDFPEPESWMIEQAESRGLRQTGRLYHDFYYVSMLFECD